MKSYFYGLLARYVSLFARPEESLASIDPPSRDLDPHLPHSRTIVGPSDQAVLDYDFILLNGTLHYERDIQQYLTRLRGQIKDGACLIVIYYSALWRPILQAATRLGLRSKTPEWNWLSHSDLANLMHLADFEVIRREPKVLLPVYVPLVSAFLNRYIAPLPIFSAFALVNVLVARPTSLNGRVPFPAPSVSVVVPARNEAGNIDAIVDRVPQMGPHDELIFVEGGSTDDTWQRICEARATCGNGRNIQVAQQKGKGKGDAVRTGFALARNEVLMILDADLTVPPEDLPKFYSAITSNKGEFINGSRLVYPMEKRAMRFLNLIANKFFAVAFSFVLGQRFKDTLCGTKVISRENYQRLARNRSYFGDFDPFGDFDLIFGAARMGLRIVEVPITYRERTYGETNISRWRHGTLLIAMLFFAARRLKFI